MFLADGASWEVDFDRPTCGFDVSDICSMVLCIDSIDGARLSTSCFPVWVRLSEWDERKNSFTYHSFSSLVIASLTAGAEIPNVLAALAKLPSLAT